MFALCKGCRRALYNWDDAPLPGMPQCPDPRYWTHLVPDGSHEPVPLSSLRERTLFCSACGTQLVRDTEGWHCPNEHCPGHSEDE